MLQLKSAWRDGTTHIKMSPLEFMQRLAALVPRPRLHLIRFHGVLAPNAKNTARLTASWAGHIAGGKAVTISALFAVSQFANALGFVRAKLARRTA